MKKFDPEKHIEEVLERVGEIIEKAFGPLGGDDFDEDDSAQLIEAGEFIEPRVIVNDIEDELIDLEDWIEAHFDEFLEKRDLKWIRASHLQFAPRPGWIAEGARKQLDAIESSFRVMRDLCLEYGPHTEENSGILAAARRVADALQDPIEGYKAYIGGHKLQVAERDFAVRFERAGIDIGTACSELGSEIITDLRRELRRLYRDVEVSTPSG